MKKILLLLYASLFSAHVVLADDVSVEQALQAASQFAIVSQPSLAKVKGYRAPRKTPAPRLAYAMPSKVAESKDNVYIINLDNNQGFVIVSGESGTEDEILGYCDHGSFNYDDAPIQLKELLDGYTNEIDRLRSNPSLAAKASRKASSALGSVVVAPLLTTTWNQWGPYNNYCPEGCPTGCVPTAFAQIMNYYKWPKETQGQLVDPVTAQFTGEDFSGHVYDWDNMLDNYSSGYNADQAEAVAHLMRDIGKSIGTSYQPEGSSSSFSTYTLAYHFSYEEGVMQSYQNADQLISIIKKDLDELHPVPYSGGSSDGINHALVCDGYTANNYLHFNYGWGGSYDGFYKPSALPKYGAKGAVYTGFVPTYDTNTIEIDNIEYALQQNGEAHIKAYKLYNQNGTVVNIPTTITYEGKEYPVTRVRKNAFYSRGHFSKMTIGDNVRAIDQFSFIQSTIDTLVLSDKMEEVPDAAFQLTRIKHLTIGSSIKRIGKQAFMMCSLGTIISRSPAFEVDDEAFMAGGTGTADGVGSWLGCITKLGSRVFASNSFNISPRFTSLRELGPEALYACGFTEEDLPYTYNGETYYWKLRLFHVFPSVKNISPTAFENTNLQGFVVEDGSPYFSLRPSKLYSKLLFNKDGSSLVVSLPQHYTTSMYGRSWGSLYLGDEYGELFTDNLLRIEPGSIHSLPYETVTITIPNTVMEMEGAFTNCERINYLTLPFEIPPAISDASFNENLFADIDKRPTLYVPVGSEELYRNAPCWRRFKVRGDEKISPVSPQDREYYMVMHKGSERISVPVSQVADMRIAQDSGQHDVVVKLRGGRDDLTSNVALVDSITWMNGFVYENAEVFELNDSTLTAEGQKCSVTFDPTVISSDVQLCIRNGVLTPHVIEGVTRGLGIDVSLSNGVHDLMGTATITIPYSLADGEKAHAAYFNEETGEWDPVLACYDEQKEAVVITTDHLSYFSVFTTLAADTWHSALEIDYDMTPGSFNLTESLEQLYKIVSNKDPEEGAVQAWRDDYGFWQSLGIDGGYNLVSSLGFTTDGIGELMNVVGYVGTYATILDAVNAAVQGDDIGVASNTLKSILSITSAQVSSVIGTSVMSAGMGLSAFIGVALEKLGTKVQASIKDHLRKAYNLYYSEAGRSLVGPQYGSKFRNTQEWFEYFYPAFSKRMTQFSLQSYIEQSVRRYTEAYWEEPTDVFTMCMAEVDSRTMTSYQYPYESIQKQISEEYYTELLNGQLVSVFEAIKNKLAAKAAKEYKAKVRDYMKWMNSNVGLNIIDSSCGEDETSQYAGWTIRLSNIPDSIKDPKNWQKTIGKDGKAKLGAFTRYALIRGKVKSQLTLVDPEGEERATYDFEIPGGTGLVVVNIDLDSGGQAIEGQGKNYDIKMEPDSVLLPRLKVYGYGIVSCWGPEPELIDELELEVEGQAYGAYFEDWYQDIVDAFKANDGVMPSLTGEINSNIGGLEMKGSFDTGTNTGSGTFKLNTSYHNVRASAEDVIHFFSDIANWSDDDITLLWNLLMEGDISHKAEGTFTVSMEGGKYVYRFTGKGIYQLDGTYFTEVKNPGWYTKMTAETDCPVTWVNPVTEVVTDDFQQQGNVSIEYRLEVKP